MHRILVRTVVIDVPEAEVETTRAFWATALRATPRRGPVFPEFHFMENGAIMGGLLVQGIGADDARIHFNLETDDIPAEVARLKAAGAKELSTQAMWVVMADPSGLPFCVAPPSSPQDFAENSVEVG